MASMPKKSYSASWKFNQPNITTATSTFESQLEAETIRYDNWLEAVKPKRSKREPKHRFLKDRDISKLMDKYFNVKEISI